MKINGTPVIDATKSILIHISQRDVNTSKTKDPASCAAAKCCMRTITQCEGARIHVGRAYLKMGGKWVRYLTSPALRTEIVAFDRGADFMPGVYSLSAIPPSMKVGTKKPKKGGPSTQGKRARKLRVYHITTNVRPRGANK